MPARRRARATPATCLRFISCSRQPPAITERRHIVFEALSPFVLFTPLCRHHFAAADFSHILMRRHFRHISCAIIYAMSRRREYVTAYL